jgi:hypothetical protein
MLTSDGEPWRRDRRILQPLFTSKRVTAYVGTIDDAADDLIRSWHEDAVAGRPSMCTTRPWATPSMLLAGSFSATTWSTPDWCSRTPSRC